jgi:hypothetical protein
MTKSTTAGVGTIAPKTGLLGPKPVVLDGAGAEKARELAKELRKSVLPAPVKEVVNGQA